MVLSKQFEPCIDDIEAITDIIIRIQFRGIVKTNIIGIYAPTATREEEYKNTFYEKKLQENIDKLKEEDLCTWRDIGMHN